ncbi:MAG: hypothetical protein HFH59_14595 [Lachnospiraceae bacterium]|nr:hypothetical protein [Lachnospiraceae bacterium]
MEKKILFGKFQHRLKIIETPSSSWVTRYRIALDTQAVATECRNYADEQGRYRIPEYLRSDVSYGSTVKAVAAYLYGEGVVSNDRICGFLNSEARCTDGTVITLNGKQCQNL